MDTDLITKELNKVFDKWRYKPKNSQRVFITILNAIIENYDYQANRNNTEINRILIYCNGLGIEEQRFRINLNRGIKNYTSEVSLRFLKTTVRINWFGTSRTNDINWNGI